MCVAAETRRTEPNEIITGLTFEELLRGVSISQCSRYCKYVCDYVDSRHSMGSACAVKENFNIDGNSLGHVRTQLWHGSAHHTRVNMHGLAVKHVEIT